MMSLREPPSGIAHEVFSSLPSLLFSLQVLGLALILLYTFNVAMPLWRIHQGVPQAPELLIHPTVWLTTMVTAASAGAWLAPSSCFPVAVGVRGRWEPPLLLSILSTLHPFYPPSFLIQSFATFLIHMERRKGVRASGVLFGYWLLCCVLPGINTVQQASAGVSATWENLCGRVRPLSCPPFPHITPSPISTANPTYFVLF